MKAKDVLKAIAKRGMTNFDIYTGNAIKKVVSEVLSGKISNKKEYVYSFEDLVYVSPSAVITTACNERVFLYEI